MCFSSPKPPPVVQRDLKAEKVEADTEATKKTNMVRAVMRLAKIGDGSLLTMGARGLGDTARTSSALATGKTTLGQ